MLSLTKKTDYALIALCYLAERRNQTVSAREVAEAFHMPAALVMNILKTLHHSGVLMSTRGTKGGYRLIADLARISVYDLIEMLEGPVHLTECSGPPLGPGESRNCKVGPSACPIQAPIHALHRKLVSFLKEVKVADVVLNGQRITTPLEYAGSGR